MAVAHADAASRRPQAPPIPNAPLSGNLMEAKCLATMSSQAIESMLHATTTATESSIAWRCGSSSLDKQYDKDIRAIARNA